MNVLALLLSVGLSAQQGLGPPDASSRAYVRIGSEDGLSHNSVTDLLEDDQGFLWIGTVDGLNRYDGRQFRIWRHHPDDLSTLSNNQVTALRQDDSGRLWVGTAHGLNAYHPDEDRFQRYPLTIDPTATYPGWVARLYLHTDGTLWVGTWEGLFRIHPEDGRLERFRQSGSGGLGPGGVVGIQEDSQGTIWVLTHLFPDRKTTLSRLASEADRQFESFPLPSDWSDGTILHIDDQDRLWVQTTGLGLIEAGPGPLIRPVLDDRRSPMFGKLGLDGAGLAWFPTSQGYLRVDLEGRRLVEVHDVSDGRDYLSAMTTDWAEDRAGNIWIGTRGGLYRLDAHRKPFRHRRHLPGDDQSLSADRISAIQEDREGGLWVASFGGGLDRMVDGVITRYRHDPTDPSSLCHDTIWHLALDHQGRLLIGHHDGLCVYDPVTGRFADHPAQTPEVWGTPARVNFALEDRQHRLWLGTPDGLVGYDPDSGVSTWYESVGQGRGPDSPRVIAMALDPAQDVVWFVSGRQVLNRFDPAAGTFTYHPLVSDRGETLVGDGGFHVYPDGRGGVWMGSASGLSLFDLESESFRHFGVRDGLPGSVVYSILEDPEGRLWLGTNAGLSRFDPGAPRGRQFRNYGLSDGLGNIEFNRHAALIDRRGWFHFGGMDGLTSFDPTRIEDNPYSPPVVLTGVTMSSRDGDRSVYPPTLEGSKLSHRENSIAFDFAVLNFTNSADNRYRYRLEGHDRDWIDAGHHPEARYAHLPPGEYRFRAQGSNNDGLWSREEASLAFSIAPPYWGTAWFRALVVLLLLALLTIAYRLRVAHLMAVERLRLRIASDLHDEVSSDLSGIALATDLLRHQDAANSATEAGLEAIQKTALRTVDNLRDIVWTLSPEHDRGASLLDRFRTTGQQLLADKDLVVEFDAELAETDMDMALRRNLYLIFKESLHNIARHSDADHIRVEARRIDGSLRLDIVDDGIGIPPGAAPGVGLDSMRRRAREMGADIDIGPGDSGGTRVRVTVPMARIRDGGSAGSTRRLDDD